MLAERAPDGPGADHGRHPELGFELDAVVDRRARAFGPENPGLVAEVKVALLGVDRSADLGVGLVLDIAVTLEFDAEEQHAAAILHVETGASGAVRRQVAGLGNRRGELCRQIVIQEHAVQRLEFCRKVDLGFEYVAVDITVESDRANLRRCRRAGKCEHHDEPEAAHATSA